MGRQNDAVVRLDERKTASRRIPKLNDLSLAEESSLLSPTTSTASSNSLGFGRKKCCIQLGRQESAQSSIQTSAAHQVQTNVNGCNEIQLEMAIADLFSL